MELEKRIDYNGLVKEGKHEEALVLLKNICVLEGSRVNYKNFVENEACKELPVPTTAKPAKVEAAVEEKVVTEDKPVTKPKKASKKATKK